MLQASGRRVRRFGRDAKGSVAILFGIALIPIVLGVGIAIDYGRALIVRERMAEAADSAALAIGSWPGLSQTELKVRAQQFFNANYPVSAIGTAAALNVSFEGDDIKIGVTAQVPTTFMKLANVAKIDVGVSTTVTKKERNIELALVLDTTGSMDSGGKLAAMKNAAKKMVETLFEGKATSETLRIAVVPFSGAVNVGSDKKDAAWIDKTAKSEIAYEDFKSGVKVFDLYDQLKNRTWQGCVRERDGDAYQLTDATPGSTAPASLFAPYFAPDEPDEPKNDYVNNYIGDGTYSSATCFSKCTSTACKRQCNTAKYNNASASTASKGPQYNCPPSKIVPLTNTRKTVLDAINDLDADGNTVIPAGLLWGWRVLSPTQPFTEGSAYNDEKWIKAIVLLTDGENMVSGGENGHNESVYNAFGFAAMGHLGNKNGSQAESNLNTKTSAICTAIKNQNPSSPILVYTIGFQVSGTTITNLLKNCATKPDMYYNSPSNDQLAAIFQDIAQGLGELRIAQ